MPSPSVRTPAKSRAKRIRSPIKSAGRKRKRSIENTPEILSYQRSFATPSYPLSKKSSRAASSRENSHTRKCSKTPRASVKEERFPLSQRSVFSEKQNKDTPAVTVVANLVGIEILEPEATFAFSEASVDRSPKEQFKPTISSVSTLPCLDLQQISLPASAFSISLESQLSGDQSALSSDVPFRSTFHRSIFQTQPASSSVSLLTKLNRKIFCQAISEVSSSVTHTDDEGNATTRASCFRNSQLDLLPNTAYSESSGEIASADLVVSPFSKGHKEWSYERRSTLRYTFKELVATSNGMQFYRSIEISEEDTVELSLSIGDYIQVIFGNLEQKASTACSDLEVHIGYICAFYKHQKGKFVHCVWLYDIPYFKQNMSCGNGKVITEELRRYRGRITEEDLLIVSSRSSAIDIKAVNCDVKVVQTIEDFESPMDETDVMYLALWKHDSEVGVLRPLTFTLLETMQSCNPYKFVYERERKNDSYTAVLRSLQLDYVPDIIPCREVEFAKIAHFLQESININQCGKILYICGMPGTGKTATVMKVLKNLQMQEAATITKRFRVAYINAMELNTPSDAYKLLARKILGIEIIDALKAFRALNSFFTRSSSQCSDYHLPSNSMMNVIILDEADYIARGKLDVFYTFFEWPSAENSNVLMLIICNTMDLPDRMARCASRVGTSSVLFTPYTHEQIQTIMEDRLQEGHQFFDPTSIKLCARIVGNLSGDIRKALHIYRRALEMTKGKKVMPYHIKYAEQELFYSAVATAIRSFPFGIKSFLTATVAEYMQNSTTALSLVNIIRRYKTILMASSHDIHLFSFYDYTKSILAKLAKMGIVAVVSYLPPDNPSFLSALTDANETSDLTSVRDKASGANATTMASQKTLKNSISADVDDLGGDVGVELLAYVDHVRETLCEDKFFQTFLC